MSYTTANLRTVVTACLIAAFAACAGCDTRSTGTWRSSTAGIESSREVNYDVDSTAEIKGENGVTVVTFDGHNVRIEKDRLLLDEKEVVKFESTVKTVDFKVVGGTMTVKADGKEILNTKISK